MSSYYNGEHMKYGYTCKHCGDHLNSDDKMAVQKFKSTHKQERCTLSQVFPYEEVRMERYNLMARPALVDRSRYNNQKWLI